MNRSKIEWCDHTWNPITGCRHDCGYCYARRMTARFSGDIRLNKMARADYRLQEAADGSAPVYVLDKPMLNETGKPLVYPFGFEPTYHRYRSNTLDKLKMGNNVFVGAMADVFGAWVPDDWIRDVIAECEKRPQHNYIFLTKNPERYVQIGVPAREDNLWYGTTITCNADADRFNYLPAFGNTFVSIEPLMEDIVEKNNVLFRQVKWIIIGAETGNRKGKVVPDARWIRNIVLAADREHIPVFMKDSITPIIGEGEMRQDYPEALKRKTISVKMLQKLYGRCCQCKAALKKSNMVTLMARTKRGHKVVQYGFLCRDCFSQHCKNLEVSAEEILKTADTKEAGTDEEKL